MPPKRDSTTETLDAISRLRADFVARFDNIDNSLNSSREEIKALKELISKQKDEINNLKTVILRQQNQLEIQERAKRECFAIIHSIPEDNKPINDHLTAVFNASNCSILTLDRSVTPFRLGKAEPNKTRPVKIKLNSSKEKNALLRAYSKLKKEQKIGKIFITPDLSPIAQKESERMRKRLIELRNHPSNKDKKIYISKGKLYVEDTVHDEFDIKNQVF